MMNLGAALNRHVVGVSAIVAALVVLGYATNTTTSRHVASLPKESSAMTRQASIQTQQAPIERKQASNDSKQASNETTGANGSTQAAESTGQKLKEQIRAMLPSLGSNAAQKEAANWSGEEWQIAEKAVADHRSGSNAKNVDNKSARSNLVWQPPQEIAKPK